MSDSAVALRRISLILPHVRRERRERLLEALLVADVGKHVVEDRELRAFARRHVQAALGHQGEQADRLQGHRLAAGVGPGHDQDPKSDSEIEVDRHHGSLRLRVRPDAARTRVEGTCATSTRAVWFARTRRQPRQVGGRRGRPRQALPAAGSHRKKASSKGCLAARRTRLRFLVEVRGRHLVVETQPSPREDQVELGHGLERRQQRFRHLADLSAQPPEDPANLFRLPEPRRNESWADCSPTAAGSM